MPTQSGSGPANMVARIAAMRRALRLLFVLQPPCGQAGIHHDHITFLQRRCELGFDVGDESRPVHGAIEHPGSAHAIMAKTGNESHRLPVPMWN